MRQKQVGIKNCLTVLYICIYIYIYIEYPNSLTYNVQCTLYTMSSVYRVLSVLKCNIYLQNVLYKRLLPAQNLRVRRHETQIVKYRANLRVKHVT